MKEKEKKNGCMTGQVNGRQNNEEACDQKKQTVSENWAEETIADLDDFIESQGIYIRQ